METKRLKFGNKEILLGPRDGDVYVYTSGLTGTFSQLKKFVEDNMKNEIHEYGKYLPETLEPPICINRIGNNITVGCLTGTVQAFILIYNECEVMLGLQFSLFDSNFQLIKK